MEDASTTKKASTMQLPDYLTNCKIYNPSSDVNVTVDGLVLQVLYGSETETAQDVAEEIWKSAQRKQRQCTVSSLDKYDMRNLSSRQLIVFVVATTGQGDLPANMKTFWKHLLDKSLWTDQLRNLNYGILGLGDSCSPKFNFAAKKLNIRLAQLGGKELLPIGFADDQNDLMINALVNCWIKELWEKIAKVFKISVEDKIQDNLIIEKYHISIYNDHILHSGLLDGGLILWPSKSDIYYQEIDTNVNINVNIKTGSIYNNVRTTSIDHFQEVRLITIELPHKIKYDPGDIIYVRPKNSIEQVRRFFNILYGHNIQLFPNTMVEVKKKEIKVPLALQCRLPLKEIVEQYWDLNFKPRQSTMHTLSLISEDKLEKKKLYKFASPCDQEELYNYIYKPRKNILEVLMDFPHTTSKLNIRLLFEIMSPIRPRPYSIASSSKATPDKIQILVAVVDYKTRLLESRFGLCSKWLKNLKINDKVTFRIQKGTFRFEDNKPIIMIGPGTGVAPFRSFLLEEEEKKKDLKECVLFFGCRKKDKDYHCREDFERLAEKTNLKVFCAFSRDQDYKIYVQHIIREQRELCWQFLQNDGSIYLAGNSKNMPNDVRDEFVDLAKEIGKMTEEQAEKFIKDLEKKNRYQIEIWD
ncbi:NADPH-dependent diflavin oxidoreductase 1 [Camponotus floridanus]|uniref:NADPH-dependent diflavin oxidoreductase 1 n=1 Tax=Camponotus floridanus TaxID=104421 RepID=UPI000DC66EBC|nr:NADPH-dependent diflavin oxidoreductase 1 [Camponotus floridanus]XP_011263627.2 NADPH-dependent diflavin oxidoreductase 1 [Camponotus floridanus]XP_011263628.2 NADPH-dependent diflavin oxidoreductase 1 [Camponotus floridanus]XP_011263629.2 NADPH-dependent diflavin oxidoreductase 1 [Camponotus floridanus]